MNTLTEFKVRLNNGQNPCMTLKHRTDGETATGVQVNCAAGWV